jgi:four helix bundle protein
MEHRRSQSIVQDKSYRFAVRLIGYIRQQPKDHVNLVLTKQLLRSGTSVGSNIEEALGGYSRKDFVAKLAVAAKEARNTVYWLRLIRETQPHDQQGFVDLLKECDGLQRILNSIILTTRRKLTSAADSEPKSRTQNSELRTQNSTLIEVVDSGLRTQHSELPNT